MSVIEHVLEEDKNYLKIYKGNVNILNTYL